MIYTIEDIKKVIEKVAGLYDIREVRLFGSYFDNVATADSDIDLIVKFGDNCRGLKRISFMNDLENRLNKRVDVINVDFLPDFLKSANVFSEERLIYAK